MENSLAAADVIVRLLVNIECADVSLSELGGASRPPGYFTDHEDATDSKNGVMHMVSAHPRVFLAHASEDKDEVYELYKKLAEHGCKPWIDKIDLIPGQNWRTEIPIAIRECDVFLACFSKSSVKKGYINKELRMALDIYAEYPPGSIYLIPVKIEECELPDIRVSQFNVAINDLHWVDIWQHDGFGILMSAIKHAAGIGNYESHEQLSNEIDYELTRVFLHEGGVNCISISPDGRLLASGGKNGWLYVWDIETGQKKWSDSAGEIADIDFSSDSRLLVWVSYGGFCISNSKNGKILYQSYNKFFKWWRCAAFSNNSDFLALGQGSRTWIGQWQKQSININSMSDSPCNVIALAFSPDDSLLAIGTTNSVKNYETGKVRSTRDTVSIWKIKGDRKELGRLELAGSVSNLAFSPDGRFLAIGGDSLLNWQGDRTAALKLWNIAPKPNFRIMAAEIPALNDTSSRCDFISFLQSGTLAAGFGNVTFFDPKSRLQIGSAPDVTGSKFAVSPDGTIIASASYDEKIKLWRKRQHNVQSSVDGDIAKIR